MILPQCEGKDIKCHRSRTGMGPGWFQGTGSALITNKEVTKKQRSMGSQPAERAEAQWGVLTRYQLMIIRDQ